MQDKKLEDRDLIKKLPSKKNSYKTIYQLKRENQLDTSMSLGGIVERNE